MDNYLLPENDGLPARPSGEYAKAKLFYLQSYLITFEKSMKNKPWRRRIYIDLFSGPGKCTIRKSKEVVLGSPLLALTAKPPFTDYFFVDKSAENVNALRTRSTATDISRDRIRCWTGDANNKAFDITKEIEQIDNEYISGVWSALNLAFLDPEGFELRWTTVAELARMIRMDLIIHYPQQGIKRMADRALASAKETAVDRFFGDTEWRKIYSSCKDDATGIHRALIDYYKSKLKVLGYVEVKGAEEVWAEPLMKNRKNAPLYRLLFASKHPLGVKFWKDITKVSANGQLPLLLK